MNRTAVISPCGAYRYSLTRDWSMEVDWSASKAGVLGWIMLNPSKANADIDDPTIRKCRGFASRLGFSRLEVVNLFAFRATYPSDMKAAVEPTGGAENDRAIDAMISRCSMIICAWGAQPIAAARAAEVLRRLRSDGRNPPLFYLDKTVTGQPCHPLMLSYKLTAKPFEAAQ